MPDISIHVSTRWGRATVIGETEAGKAWVRRKFTEPAPVSVTDEAAREIEQEAVAEHLDVLVR